MRIPGTATRLAWWAGVLTVSLLVGAEVLDRTWPIVLGTVVGSPAEFTADPDDAGLPGKAVPILDSRHIPVGEAESARYNSIPPTSGPHFTASPAPGLYDEPLPEGLQVHALEHGHVGIQYAVDTPASTVEALRRLGARYPGDVFVAPCPKLARGIALTAWGRLDTLDSLDEERVVRFVLGLRGRYDHGWAGAGEP